MPSLREIQRRFQHGLFGADDGGALSLFVGDDAARAAGFDVYRNNAANNYREALRDTFPAVERIVGEAFFACLAARYTVEVPSTSGTLDDFGATFAQFIETFPGTEALPYLPDLARLEWALHRVFHAGAHAPLESARLASLLPEQLERAHLVLNPAAALVASAYPILAIWKLGTGAASSEDTIALEQGADHLLVLRAPDLQPRIHRLDAATFALLARSSEGLTVGEALDEALASDEAFDFSACLVEQLRIGSIVDVRAH